MLKEKKGRRKGAALNVRAEVSRKVDFLDVLKVGKKNKEGKKKCNSHPCER
jgi:hypothetical protein